MIRPQIPNQILPHTLEESPGPLEVPLCGSHLCQVDRNGDVGDRIDSAAALQQGDREEQGLFGPLQLATLQQHGSEVPVEGGQHRIPHPDGLGQDDRVLEGILGTAELAPAPHQLGPVVRDADGLQGGLWAPKQLLYCVEGRFRLVEAAQFESDASQSFVDLRHQLSLRGYLQYPAVPSFEETLLRRLQIAPQAMDVPGVRQDPRHQPMTGHRLGLVQESRGSRQGLVEPRLVRQLHHLVEQLREARRIRWGVAIEEGESDRLQKGRPAQILDGSGYGAEAGVDRDAVLLVRVQVVQHEESTIRAVRVERDQPCSRGEPLPRDLGRRVSPPQDAPHHPLQDGLFGEGSIVGLQAEHDHSAEWVRRFPREDDKGIQSGDGHTLGLPAARDPSRQPESLEGLQLHRTPRHQRPGAAEECADEQ